MDEVDDRTGTATTSTLRGCLAVILFLFAGFFSISGILTRIDSTEDFRDSLIIDGLVGLAVFALIALVLAPSRDLRKRRVRYVVGFTLGVVVSSLLVSWHNLQVEARKEAGQHYDKAMETGK